MEAGEGSKAPQERDAQATEVSIPMTLSNSSANLISQRRRKQLRDSQRASRQRKEEQLRTFRERNTELEANIRAWISLFFRLHDLASSTLAGPVPDANQGRALQELTQEALELARRQEIDLESTVLGAGESAESEPILPQSARTMFAQSAVQPAATRSQPAAPRLSPALGEAPMTRSSCRPEFLLDANVLFPVSSRESTPDEEEIE
jgi:hypothetical protein